ncbi:MAG TPA: phage tail sheath subtilisin-like domain-containing protein [Terracidiphilus sp.]|nr:phage tail sheath subtilisin-like domain-containing protein [Terracidiphilus sp.]
MPLSRTYPGVYVQEVTGGVHPIVGVPTCITAFVGRTVFGPVNVPTNITSYSDFERDFGGIDIDYPMSYAVNDFFQNDGTQAVVVRLYQPDPIKPAKAVIKLNGLSLEAASEGCWGNHLRVRVDNKVSAETASALGLTISDLVNLTICDTRRKIMERFLNVSVRESARRVDRVLSASALMRVKSAMSPALTLPAPHIDPQPGEDIWAQDRLSTPVAAVDEVGNDLALKDSTYLGDKNLKTGIYAFENADIFNVLCIPPDTRGGDVPAQVLSQAASYCVTRRAMLIIDPPSSWTSANEVAPQAYYRVLGMAETASQNAAIYFPRIRESDPVLKGQLDTLAPCGVIAGVWARTDALRGVWKAPAGTEAALKGVQGLAVTLTEAEEGELNSWAINCLRSFPEAGLVVWGARTLQGVSNSGGEFQYIPVRRLALFIEESVYRGTQWAVFEPNDNRLREKIRLNIVAFMNGLFHQGAFAGAKPEEAYFVKCDNETTTQVDIDQGLVNILVGFAPLKPAEFIILKIQQAAGQSSM